MTGSRLLWPTREELRRRLALMDKMMQKRGADAAVVRSIDGGMAFVEAQAKCRYCRHEEACRRWLTVKAPRTSPDFCPNAAFFSSCRETCATG